MTTPNTPRTPAERSGNSGSLDGEEAGADVRDPAVYPEIRRAARCYVSLASLGGRPGVHLQAFVTAAMQWADADRAEREATAAASAALSGPRSRWQEAKRAHDAATLAEQAARDTLLIVARNVAIDARRSVEDHDDALAALAKITP